MMESQPTQDATAYASTRISRLLIIYLDGGCLRMSATPLSVPLIQRLMRCIIAEGYGA